MARSPRRRSRFSAITSSTWPTWTRRSMSRPGTRPSPRAAGSRSARSWPTDGQHSPVTDADAAVAQAFQQEWGRIVATLIRMTGDWDLAEECAQDAFATAIARWPADGVPDRPGAWLTTTARNRALDKLRR